MYIDRYMVNLFFEIRRNLPLAQQSHLRIAAVDLGEKMIALYQQTEDENIRVLVERFLERAGEDWLSRALKPAQRYRGAKVDKAKSPSQAEKVKAAKKQKGNYYRGVLLD
ncbi:MAG: hypothetical protein AAF431_05465 [Pseudomonadota bacterium]